MKALRIFDPEYMPFYPVQLLLELTTVCNLTCRTCYRSVGNVSSVHMSEELLDSVITQVFPHIYHVELIGLGEALCSPHFSRITEVCRSMGIRIGTSTNGMLMTPEIADRLAACESLIVLSVDGCSDDTLGYVRPGVTRAKIEHAMRCLRDARERHPKSTFRWSIHSVLLRRNVDEIDDLIRWGSAFGCTRFSFSHFDTLDRTDPFASEGLAGENAIISSRITRWEETARSVSASLLIPSGMRTMPDSAHSRQFGTCPGRYFQKCYLPWRETQIFVNGVVTQCCVGGTDLGNLNDASFRQIWNGERYRSIRRTIHSGHPPEPCSRCTMDYGITGGDPAYFERCRGAGLSR